MRGVAIVDYGMGNLASVAFACQSQQIPCTITSSPDDVASATGVVLPGVGAFGDAMRSLTKLGLADAIIAAAHSGAAVMGVCLGMQLLATESDEFGHHAGLGLISGDVVQLEGDRGCGAKVPHVGWAALHPSEPGWEETPLRRVVPGTHMYFVHSYVLRPSDESLAVSFTAHGHARFCSSLQSANIFACQFHPERSGAPGLSVYREMFSHVASKVDS